MSGTPPHALALLDGLIPATIDTVPADARGGQRIEIREASFQLGPDGRAMRAPYRRFSPPCPSGRTILSRR
jgi:hypothetical protein